VLAGHQEAFRSEAALNVRPLLIGVPALCGILLSSCASSPAADKPFSLIKPQESWVQMQAPPADSAAIIESAGQSTKDMLADKKRYKITWFSRKTDDYLIYFQVRDSASDCGDEAPEFYKDDGKWAEDRLSRISICH
jgi:hypothetical protein